MTKTLPLAALAVPAFAGNVDLGAQLGPIVNDGPNITIRTHCGNLGMGSRGGCRSGIIGLIDEQQHGTCWIDRRSGRPMCER